MSNKIKTIEKIGFQWGMDSPFLACMHHQDRYPAGNEEQGPSVSLAGRRMGNDFSGKDGFSMYHGVRVLELFQIWLNLPAKSKFTDPDYKMLWAEDIPVIKSTNEGGKSATIRLIAGRYQKEKALEPTKASWAAREENHVGIQLVALEPGAEFYIAAGSNTLNRNLYYYQGEDFLTIDGNKIAPSSRIKLSGEEAITVVNGEKPSYVLLLEGEPIEEPVAQYGPFVMNTEQEIRNAYEDYQRTQFGGWPWPEDEPVHERSEGRFAHYPDGHVEKR